MAIQLNERDQLIFKLIDEHEVLLEKHISWFIAQDDKPVLIRDRLRKLFYLDYLICHRHGSKLPWWTTPTKPLVYMLSPMARKMSGFAENSEDILDNDFQRYHLEVANLRMLFLVAQKNGTISDFQWSTCKGERKKETGLCAKVTYNCGGKTLTLGIVNHAPGVVPDAEHLNKALVAEKLDWLLFISQEERACDAGIERALVATHQDLYREGIISNAWRKANGDCVDLTTGAVVPTPAYMSNYVNGTTNLNIAV